MVPREEKVSANQRNIYQEIDCKKDREEKGSSMSDSSIFFKNQNSNKHNNGKNKRKNRGTFSKEGIRKG